MRRKAGGPAESGPDISSGATPRQRPTERNLLRLDAAASSDESRSRHWATPPLPRPVAHGLRRGHRP